MTKNPSPSERVTGQMSSELNAQTPRLVTQLQNEFAGPDRTNTTTSQWHDLIRTNWDDPQWRAEQAVRMGDVAFVKDAMSAFGIPHAALADHPTVGPTMPTGPTPNPAMPMPPEPQT